MTDESKAAAFARRYRDLIFGSVLLIFFIWVIADVQSLQLLVKARINAKFWPTLVGMTGSVLSVLLMLQGFSQGRKRAELERSGAVAAPAAPEKWFRGGNLRSNLTIVLIILYMAALGPAGWSVSTFLYLSVQFYVLVDPGRRNVPRILAIAFLFTAVVYILFRYAFMLILPTGTLWN
jgi:hypothetical protein